MIGRVLCWLGLHDWEEYAMVVTPTNGEVSHVCLRCSTIRVWRFP